MGVKVLGSELKSSARKTAAIRREGRMDVSKLRKMFILDEGKKDKAYRCSVGKLTIGIGRNLDDVGLSDDEQYYLLNNDVERATRACIAIFGKGLWDKWSENRKNGMA